MSRPFPSRSSFSSHQGTRINGKIRAREVRVVAEDGRQLGVLSLGEAINLARSQGVDLVEVAPNAVPPVCRLVDYGKYKYEQSKRDRDARKHQHANKVKEIQLSPQIDPHDFGVKLSRAIDFLCEEMKVKVVLKFRGREMAHKEYGFQQVEKFTREVSPYGHPDNEAKLVGRGITVMFSPLPRNKRAKNPHQIEGGEPSDDKVKSIENARAHVTDASPVDVKRSPKIAAQTPPSTFGNNPFANLDLNARKEESEGSSSAT